MKFQAFYPITKQKKIKNLSNIKRIEHDYNYKASTNGNNLLVNSYSKNDTINKPTILSGTYPKKNEIAVDSLYLTKNKLKIGDNINLVIADKHLKAKISGTIRSPKYLYLTEDISEPVPNHKKYGYSIIHQQTLKKINLPSNLLVITENSKSKENNLINQIHTINQSAYITKKQNLASYKMINSKLETIKNISMAISSVFIILTIAITLISYSKQISNKRPEISLLKALGVPKKYILIYLSFLGIVTASVGTIIGSLIGFFAFPKIIQQTLATLFEFPKFEYSNYSTLIVASFIIVLLLELTALIINTHSLLNESTAKTLRPINKKVNAHLFLEKTPIIWNHISLKTKLLFRNIASGKLKFVFSIVVISFCVTILISAFGLKFALSDIEKKEFEDVRNYDISINLKNNNSSKLSIQNDPHITSVDKYSVIPAKINDIDTHLNIINQNVHSISLISNNTNSLKFNNLNGVYISKKLANHLNVKTGKLLNIKIFLNNEYTNLHTPVKGIYNSYTSQGLYTTYEYLRDKNISVPIQTEFIKTKHLLSEKKKLANNPMIKNVLLKRKQAQNYKKASESVNSILLMIVIIAALLLFAVVYNISSINISERKRDIATEKVLGLQSSSINKLFLEENTILIVLSTILGVVISPFMYNTLGNAIASDDMSFPSQFNIISIPISIILIILFLLLTSIFLVNKIKKIDKLSALNSFK